MLTAVLVGVWPRVTGAYQREYTGNIDVRSGVRRPVAFVRVAAVRARGIINADAASQVGNDVCRVRSSSLTPTQMSLSFAAIPVLHLRLGALDPDQDGRGEPSVVGRGRQ